MIELFVFILTKSLQLIAVAMLIQGIADSRQSGYLLFLKRDANAKAGKQ